MQQAQSINDKADGQISIAEKETNIDPRNILAYDNTHYDNKSVVTAASKLTKGTLRTVIERNPYRFIEQALK